MFLDPITIAAYIALGKECLELAKNLRSRAREQKGGLQSSVNDLEARIQRLEQAVSLLTMLEQQANSQSRHQDDGSQVRGSELHLFEDAKAIIDEEQAYLKQIQP